MAGGNGCPAAVDRHCAGVGRLGFRVAALYGNPADMGRTDDCFTARRSRADVDRSRFGATAADRDRTGLGRADNCFAAAD